MRLGVNSGDREERLERKLFLGRLGWEGRVSHARGMGVRCGRRGQAG